MELALWLRTHRDCWTIKAFAAAIGVHEGTVYKWLSGENIPRPRPLAAISRVTNGAVTPGDFYAPGDATCPHPPKAISGRA